MGSGASVTYFRPTELTDAIDWLADNEARIAAGCTDLFAAETGPSLKGPVLDVTAVTAMRKIERLADHWRIGAAATWTDVLRADLPVAFDGLKLAAREVGSVQIQNAGTVGGNLCNASPAADGVPPLLTLDASVEIASKSGVRTLLLQDFITGPRQTALAPGELLTAVLVPEAAGAGRANFVKLGARKYLVISIAMVAVRLVELEGHVAKAAVAVGACSAVAQRLPAVEKALQGEPMVAGVSVPVTDAMIADALAPITDIRADAEYRADAACELVRRTLEGAVT
jgi:CO/xanthine dehydrogenase FAD-binding subunit